jgi:hypothetical protein
MFLIRTTGQNQKAHIWVDGDTACRMWSTGGLKKYRFAIKTDRGNHKICHMCKQVADRGVDVNTILRLKAIRQQLTPRA